MIVQGSAEWFAARLGKVTASRVADVIAKTKTGYSASRANYMAELIAERLSGARSEGFTNAAMQWGTDKEPDARAAYCFMRDVDVAEVGFIDHPTIAMTGASPDGLVGDDGMLEIKCPNTATHLETLLGAVVPAKYFSQMQWQMACADRQWCDFASYDPRLPEPMRLFIQRVPRDADWLRATEEDVAAFLSELDAKIDALTARYLSAAA